MNRVVVLVRKLDQGGTERQIVTLAKAMKKSSDVHVLLFYMGGVFDDELTAAGAPTHFVGKCGRWDVFGFIACLIASMRKLRLSLIYLFLNLPNIMAALIVRPQTITWHFREGLRRPSQASRAQGARSAATKTSQ